MALYRIESRTSGAVLGEYAAGSEREALDVMARDAGYRDQTHAAEVTGDDGSHLDVTEVTCSWHVGSAVGSCRQCGQVRLCAGCAESGAYCEACRGDE